MRAVVQRVSSASVTVDNDVVGAIDQGVLILVAAAHEDTEADAIALAKKVAGLRIFTDETGKMNLDVRQVGGAVLAVSQFTLFGDCRKGRRPSFVHAARPEPAVALYEQFVEATRKQGLTVETGVFQADMQVTLVNDGPVTILLDTTRLF